MWGAVGMPSIRFDQFAFQTAYTLYDGDPLDELAHAVDGEDEGRARGDHVECVPVYN